jgi:CheY-like chemotaxis protein
VRPSGSTIPAVGRRRRILVVDDEEPIRSAVAAWLEQSGHQALTAADGDAAIAALAVEPHPDLVLLDLAMPGRSGIETFSILRERVPGLPVLLMSGYNPHAADDLLAAGACGFLQKPFRAADLAGAIAALP